MKFRSRRIPVQGLMLVLPLLLAGCAESTRQAAVDDTVLPKYTANPQVKAVASSLIRHEYANGEVASLCKAGLDRLQASIRGEVKDVLALDRILADVSDELSPLTFMGYVNVKPELRAEASSCEESYSKAMVDVFTSRALYKAVLATEAKDAGQKRLVSEFKRQFEANGMALPDDKLQQLKALKSELAELETKFQKNLNEDTSSVEFTAAELDGASPEFLKRLRRGKNGRYIVTTKSTDYTQLMDNVRVPDTRRRMLTAYDNRAPDNTALLERAVVLRQQIAQMVGYPTWADYQTNGRMAANAANVQKMLGDLKAKLRPRLEADLAILLKGKQEMEDPKTTRIDAWDIRYFENQVKKRDYAVDSEVIREYFPKDRVMAGLFEIYSTLLGVRYEQVPNASVWSPDVTLYAIREVSDDSIVGYFYADFVPREGKYGHAAAFTLISGRMLDGGWYSQPVSSIVANFSPPSGDRPSLLTHDEVETLFHEFGHIMHQTLTRAPYASLSGSGTARDFVEAPSQMLENWVWDKAMLRKISGHYKTNEPLPDALIDKMIAARRFNQGYFYSRQLMLGTNDMAMHTANGPVDATATYLKAHNDVLGISPVEGSHMNGTFGHMMGGYDAGYYGYLWSEVYAADMFTRFAKEGLLSTAAGAGYRQYILEQGNMSEPLGLVEKFVGRKSDNTAFLKTLGL